MAEKIKKNSKNVGEEGLSLEGIFTYSKICCDIYWELFFLKKKKEC